MGEEQRREGEGERGKEGREEGRRREKGEGGEGRKPRDWAGAWPYVRRRGRVCPCVGVPAWACVWVRRLAVVAPNLKGSQRSLIKPAPHFCGAAP
jgi:hypothetical protein